MSLLGMHDSSADHPSGFHIRQKGKGFHTLSTKFQRVFIPLGIGSKGVIKFPRIVSLNVLIKNICIIFMSKYIGHSLPDLYHRSHSKSV